MDILPKFAPETARKQDASVLAALALHDMQLTMIQIHILEPHARQLRVSQPRINQELDHDHVSRVARVPNGFVKADQFMIGEQFREPLSEDPARRISHAGAIRKGCDNRRSDGTSA
jgi:hypothetical protein